MTPTTELLDERQAAAALGAKAGTLRVWRTKGRGPAYVRFSSKMVRYRREDIDAYIAAHWVEPEAS